MYVFEEMIDLGLEEGKQWTSPLHKTVAQNLLLNNPRITTRDTLTECVNKINSIPKSEIRSFSFYDAFKLGIPL
jgi:hypothetical protein